MSEKLTVAGAGTSPALDPGSLEVTRNACKLCMPLGASLAFKGVEGTLGLLHGSQGCATYIRRYLISHFREPLDIASSNFTEHTTVYGGSSNLHTALDNLMLQYSPECVGVASTCLSETIGEDLKGMLDGWLQSRKDRNMPVPVLVGASTPSYAGSHREGFQLAVRELVRQVPADRARTSAEKPMVNILPGMVSPADLRWLKDSCRTMGLDPLLLPDYSDSMDGGLWEGYQSIPPGGTPLADVAAMRSAVASVELGALPLPAGSAGLALKEGYQVPLHSLDLPMGVSLTDRYWDALADVRALRGGSLEIPAEVAAVRSRLADALVDAHKYVSGIPVVVYGEEDFALAMTVFLAETGLKPVVCASGGRAGLLKTRLLPLLEELRLDASVTVADDSDFIRIQDLAKAREARLVVGNSKGHKLSKALDIPLVRVGFPIHDRFGGPRILHLGYEGALQILDRVVNAVIEERQDRSPVGYTYY